MKVYLNDESVKLAIYVGTLVLWLISCFGWVCGPEMLLMGVEKPTRRNNWQTHDAVRTLTSDYHG